MDQSDSAPGWSSVSSAQGAELPDAYPDAHAQLLSARGALRTVLNYATDFIARGDIDVLFTLSGGAIDADGQSADPAVWSDWLIAWRSVPPEDRAGSESESIDVQHGFRALYVFLERQYQPVAETPMRHVRDDCADALDSGAGGVAVWTRWREALVVGENADISFRLSKP